MTYTTSTTLPAAARAILEEAANARIQDTQKKREDQTPLPQHIKWCQQIEGALTQHGVPEVLTSALGRCLFRRYVKGCPNFHTRLSTILKAWQQSGEAGVYAARQ